MTDQEIREWFKDHIVKTYIHQEIPGLEHLFFARPESNNYSLIFIRTRGTLFVGGDLGDAIYCWSQDNSLEWISNCNFGYFHGKCHASPSGRKYVTWNSEHAIKTILDHFDHDPDAVKRIEDSSWRDYIHSEFEWFGWCNENATEVFEDQDWWEWAGSVGEVPDIHCRSHLIGLQEAMKKLNKGDTNVQKITK